MLRKSIGVFISGDDDQLHCTLLQGIKERAFSYDYNVISFHSLLHKTTYGSKNHLSKTVIDGEYSIFWGHDFSALDGIILIGETFISLDTKDRLVERAKESNIPVVDIADVDERCCSILFEDSCSMEMVVSHIVKEHGCKKIFYVSGFKGNTESEQRIAAYYKILKENDIEINEDFICYGEFNTKIAANRVEKLVRTYGIPDAIVCANDSMALGCITRLSKLGYSVPEDCIVTGFDGIREGQEYFPALTSVKRAIRQMGITAVDTLDSIFKGEKPAPRLAVPSELILNQSCGCVQKSAESINEFYNLMNNTLNDLRFFDANLINMTRLFMSCDTIEEIVEAAMDYAEAFRIPRISFYINEDIVHARDEINMDEAVEKETIYSPMLIRYTRDYTTAETRVERVPSPSVLSDILEASDEKMYVGLSPLYFQEKIIGFVNLEHLYCASYLPMLYVWLISVCSTIGNCCLRVEMKTLIDTLDDMYIKDSLTGLNNRFGLHRYAEKIIKRARRDGKDVFGLEIDLDRLKVINDTYGHNDGDNAIVQVANAMRQAADEGIVLSRIGGDEYFAIGISADGGEAVRFINKVNLFLHSYNHGSTLAYDIECSCGYYISEGGKHDLEEIMKYSDIEMYKEKKEKKKKVV